MENAATSGTRGGLKRTFTVKERLAALYRTHGPAARRLAFLLTGDRDTAEDLVQDAFVRLFRRYADLRADGDIAAYLRKTVVHLAVDQGRRRRRETEYRARIGRDEPQVAAPEAPDDDLWLALQDVAPRVRVALVLRYYEDLSEQQTADAMGCAVGTVKSYTSRGLKHLRARMESDDA